MGISTAMHSLLFWHWNWNLPHVDDLIIAVCVVVMSANRTPNGGIVEVVINMPTSDTEDCLYMIFSFTF